MTMCDKCAKLEKENADLKRELGGWLEVYERLTHTPSPTPAQAVSDDTVSLIRELMTAMRSYEMDVDEPAPPKHRDMIERAERFLNATPTPAQFTERNPDEA